MLGLPNFYTDEEILWTLNTIFNTKIATLEEMLQILKETEIWVDKPNTKLIDYKSVTLLTDQNNDYYVLFLYPKNKSNLAEEFINKDYKIFNSKFIPKLNAISALTRKKTSKEINLNKSTSEHKSNTDIVLKEISNMDYLSERDISILDKILKQYGKFTPKYLGAGLDGRAFLIAPGMVLKIFRGSDAYYSYKQIYDLLWSGKGHKYDVMVYDVGMFQDSPLYWVLMEKLDLKFNDRDDDDKSDWWFWKNEISNNKNVLNLKTDFINQLSSDDFKNSDKLNEKIIEFELKTKALKIAEEIYDEAIDTLSPYFKNKMSENEIFDIIVSMIINTCLDKNDLHAGNIGFRKDKPIFFDPVY